MVHYAFSNTFLRFAFSQNKYKLQDSTRMHTVEISTIPSHKGYTLYIGGYDVSFINKTVVE